MADGSGVTRSLDLNGRAQTFKVGYSQIRTIEDILDIGIFALQTKLVSRTHKTDDVRCVLKQGLIGAGASEKDAELEMVEAFEVNEPNLVLLMTMAQIVVLNALTGPELDKDDLYDEPVNDAPEKQSGGDDLEA